MKATVKGRIISKNIKEPKQGSDQKTKYQVAINNGGLINDVVLVSSAMFQRLEVGKELELLVDISAWAFDGKSGLSVRESL